MICPKCDFDQPQAIECARCGVIVAKAKTIRERPAPRAPAASTNEVIGQRARVVASRAAGRAASGSKRAAKAAGGQALAAVRITATTWRLRPPSLRHRTIFFREAGRMLDKGIAIPETLTSLQAVTRRGPMAPALAAMAKSVSAGSSLSEAMAEHPSVFDATELALVETAEVTGRLGELFGRLHQRLQVLLEVRNKVLMSLVYPGLTVLLACVLLPVAKLFTHGLSAYLTDALGALFVVMTLGFMLGVVAPWVIRHPALQPHFLRLGTLLPGLALLMRRRRLALIFGALAAGLECGLDIRNAITLAMRAPGEARTIAAGERMVVHLDGGSSFSEAAREIPGASSEVIALLATGEKTGDLAEAASLQAAEHSERYRAGVQVAGVIFRMAASLLITIMVALSIMGQFQKVLADPFAMMPKGERLELQQELERAQPQLR